MLVTPLSVLNGLVIEEDLVFFIVIDLMTNIFPSFSLDILTNKRKFSHRSMSHPHYVTTMALIIRILSSWTFGNPA